MVLNSNVYDSLKWLVQIVLPAIGTCYAALAVLWGFPYAEQVVGSISAICVLLGACLRISNSNYDGDGVLLVNNDADEDNELKYNLVLKKSKAELAAKNSFMVSVKNVKAPENQ